MVSDVRAPLFVPADRPDRVAKAAATRADAVICDLEDAVAEAGKADARDRLTLPEGTAHTIIRVNGTGTDWHTADIDRARHLRPSAVMLPKCEDAGDVSGVISALDGIALIALIETAAGLAAARDIARLPGVSRLAFGSVDFCTDLMCAHDREILLPVRSEIVLASRLAGIAAPLDGVTLAIDKEGVVRSDADHARAIGMSGKMLIHPRQIDPTLTAFAPSQEQVDWANAVLAAPEGASRVNGEMIDAPVRQRARTILSEAARLADQGSPQ